MGGSSPRLGARASNVRWSTIHVIDARRSTHGEVVPRDPPDFPRFSGGVVEGATPDPIPNSVVKPFRADGTACASVWESRSLPELNSNAARWMPCGVLLFGSVRSHDAHGSLRVEVGARRVADALLLRGCLEAPGYELGAAAGRPSSPRSSARASIEGARMGARTKPQSRSGPS